MIVLASAKDLALTRVTEHGQLFETGRPVTFTAGHNTEKSPNFGKTYQQDIEPAGVYVIAIDPAQASLPRGWARETVHLRSPLVLAATTSDRLYDDGGWKARLTRITKKKRMALTQLLVRLGYDGIVTVDKYGTGEIVLLTRMRPRT